MPVYKDKKNGKWYCKFYYEDWTGERKQKWKRGFSTKKEAQDFERAFQQRYSANPGMTLGELYGIYLEEMSARLKHSTILIKENIYKTKILPYFADKPVCEIRAVDIRRWQNCLIQENHFSGTYLKAINNQLTALINYARKYYNLQTNPCEQAGSIGTSKAKEMQYWTLEEFLRFREGIRARPSSYLCFEILYWTGIREGELLALTPGDVDLQKKEINIDKTYQRLEGKDIITSPKTSKSNRKVPIPDFLVCEIQDFIKENKRALRVTDRFFPYTRAFLAREMKRGCQNTGVKRIRIHDIRHSHVSLLINQGFDALVIAERVGHEKVSTTLNTYSHLFPNRQEKVVARLETLGTIQTVAD